MKLFCHFSFTEWSPCLNSKRRILKFNWARQTCVNLEKRMKSTFSTESTAVLIIKLESIMMEQNWIKRKKRDGKHAWKWKKKLKKFPAQKNVSFQCPLFSVHLWFFQFIFSWNTIKHTTQNGLNCWLAVYVSDFKMAIFKMEEKAQNIPSMIIAHTLKQQRIFISFSIIINNSRLVNFH